MNTIQNFITAYFCKQSLKKWARFSDEKAREHEEAFPIGAAMVRDSIEHDTRLQTPKTLAAVENLALNAKSALVRETGIRMLGELGLTVDTFRVRALEVLEATSIDTKNSASAEAGSMLVEYTRHPAYTKRIGEALAKAMANPDASLRQSAIQNFEQASQLTVRSPETWENDLVHVFNSAAAQNKLPAADIAAVRNSMAILIIRMDEEGYFRQEIGYAP